MAGILFERPRQIVNLFRQPVQPNGVSISYFRQIRYLPFCNVVPEFDLAMFRDKVDCDRDLPKQLIEFDGAAKVLMTV